MRLETSFVTTLLLVGCCAASETVRHTLLPDTKIWNATDIAAVQAEIRRGNPSPVLSASLEVAVASADAALGLPLNSVMDKPYTPPNGNKVRRVVATDMSVFVLIGVVVGCGLSIST